MAEDNKDLEQQLEANLASFEGAGLDEEAKSTKAALDKLKGSKAKESKKDSEPKREESRQEPRKTTARKEGK